MAASSKIMLLNGPNLNMLGVREPAIYGTDTLDDIRANCLAKGAALGFEIDFRQSNSEGELVGWIQSARGDHGGIIINPAAYTHTSIAILDALIAAELPVIELHLSNPLRREAFRRHSYVSEVARGVICGFGGRGYGLAIDAMAGIISDAGDGA